VLISIIYTGAELPYHLYVTPYESKKQQGEALVKLRQEWEEEKAAIEQYNLINLGILNPVELPLLKERGKDRKGGIDWFIYRERILTPLLYPFVASVQAALPGVVIMEDNAPAHIHHYHDQPRQQLGMQKLEWPANSPDLNPIETIWCEMKDRIRERLGIRMTAARIRIVVEDEWLRYPMARINQHIMSMQSRIEACIADEGGNSFNH